ncbi:MAG: hypothetical protein ACTSQO_11900 [Candidatus Helarchaeota archaeon]
MNYRIVFDETHHEIFSNKNCKKLSNLLKKHSFISFRLLIGPIKPDNLTEEEYLFIGAPKDSFSQEEVETIINFVRNGGFIIIVCNSMRNNSFNINSLAKHFGIRFDFNHVKDSKNHWKSAEYFPLITNFNKSHLTKNVNKLYYSGATLTLNGNDCYPIAFTSKDAEPPNSPIIAISSKGHCIAIGGSTMFYDDEYGISAGNNSVFVSNLFKYLIWAKKYPDKVIEYRQISPRPDFSTRKIPLKKASEILNKKIKEIYNDYNKIFDKIDKLMDNIINIIQTKRNKDTEAKLKSNYKEIQDQIQSWQIYLFEVIEKLENDVNRPLEFVKIKNEKLNEFYVKESEVIEHLDRIYGRLSYYIKHPEAIP